MAIEKNENDTVLKIWRLLFVSALLVLGAIVGFQLGQLIVGWVSNPNSTNQFVVASRDSLGSGNGRTTALAALHVSATCSATLTVASSSVAVGLVGEVLYGASKNPLAVPKGSSVVLVKSSGTAATTTTTAHTTTTVSVTTTTHSGPPTTSTSTTSTTTTTLHPTALAMPNLVGMSQSQVHAALKVAGLYYKTQGPGHGTTKWTHVVSTIPAAGTKVPFLSTVILNVAE